MIGDFPEHERDELDATRAAMRRDLTRASRAVGIVLVVVLALAVVAVFAGMRAANDSTRALKAEAGSTEQLWHSYLAQTRAVRLTTEAGRRAKIFAVISNAAAIHTDAALRSEMIAALALSDVEPSQPLQKTPNNFYPVEMEQSLERGVYAGGTNEVTIYRVKDGQPLQTLAAKALGPGLRMVIETALFSPDGSKIAARFAGGALIVWDAATLQPLMVSGLKATNAAAATRMYFSADGNEINFSDVEAQGQISIFNFVTKIKTATGIHAGALPFRVRPGVPEIAIVTDKGVNVCSYSDPTPLQTFTTPLRIYEMEWSPDGSQLAVPTEDGDIYLWDVVRRSQRILRGHSEPCIRLTFSPDGMMLASGSRDNTTRLWDVAQGQTLVTMPDGIAGTFSSDGQRLGYWKFSVGYGVWQLVSSESCQVLNSPKSGGAFLSLDLSPDGRWCLASLRNGVQIWDLQNGARGDFIPCVDARSARLAQDGTAVYVCRAQSLERWPIEVNADGVKIISEAKKTIALPDGKDAGAISLSLDGRHAVVELMDRRLAVLDLLSNSPPVFLAEKSRRVGMRASGTPTGTGRFNISPDGRWVVTGFGIGPDDHPMVWDAATGKLVATLDFATAVAVFSPDGQRLGTVGTSRFALWSVGDWRLLNNVHRDEVSVTHGSMAFVRDSDEIAITCKRQIAQLRKSLTNEIYADLIAPQLQSVNVMRMSFDGRILVTASSSDQLQVWHLDELRKKLAPLNLDWRTPPAVAPAASDATTKNSSPVQNILAISLAGFAVAALVALASLRRHRSAITSYLTAETKSAQRAREFEMAKTELMHSQKMQALGTLATGIAHDFNNLLSVIRMSNKLIGRETKTNADIQENVADIEQAVLQGKSVVSSMLGYSRTEETGRTAVDLSVLVEETVALLSKEFLSGIALTLELERNSPLVPIHRGHIEQVLLNLLVNASEAMGGQGKLKVTVALRKKLPPLNFILRPSPAEQFFELSLTDSGPGISPEIRARLFEPFFTTKRSGAQPGTGLGLSLVYSIAQTDQLGLSVESEPGTGAKFILVIPLENTPVRETHSSPAAAPLYAGEANDGNRK